MKVFRIPLMKICWFSYEILAVEGCVHKQNAWIPRFVESSR